MPAVLTPVAAELDGRTNGKTFEFLEWHHPNRFDGVLFHRVIPFLQDQASKEHAGFAAV